jgi:hypothetical protein
MCKRAVVLCVILYIILLYFHQAHPSDSSVSYCFINHFVFIFTKFLLRVSIHGYRVLTVNICLLQLPLRQLKLYVILLQSLKIRQFFTS